MTEIAIRVINLIKDFDVYKHPSDLAIEVITRRARHVTFRALDHVDFEVKRGEIVGIIGSNGAGKSTLLKIITGVLEPTSGDVQIQGRVTAILELGLGFNPEYSGRDNVYLSGLLYGMTRKEIDMKLQSIIDFSGIREFIERPVKTYSSGMHSRLAFSIATAVDPDILIIDEALAAGDSAFVQKCLRRIRALCSNGRTVLLVSHGTGLLAQLCQRVIWLEHGKVREIGSAIRVVQSYDLAAHQGADAASWIETVDDDLSAKTTVPTPPMTNSDLKNKFNSPVGDTERQVFRRGPAFIEGVEMFDHDGLPTSQLTLLKPFSLKIHYRIEGELPKPTLGLALAINQKHDLTPVAQSFTQNIRPFETRETYNDAVDRSPAHKRGTMVASFPYVPFRKGEYLLSIGLVPNEPATWEFYEYRHLYYPFTVDDAGMEIGAPMFLLPTLRNIDRDSSAHLPAPAVVMQANVNKQTLRGEIDARCKIDGRIPDNWPRHVTCPACAGKVLFPAFEKYGFQHDRCGACGFVSVNPYPPLVVLNALYAGDYYSQVRELFELPLLEKGGIGTPFSAPSQVLNEIITRAAGTKQDGHWLDVGGGLGAFAMLISSRFPRWRVTLNEMNPRSIEIARGTFGLDVTGHDAQALLASGRRFDVVSSIAVLEHSPNPLDFLVAYGRLVVPGGWLVTAVPHFSALNAAVSKGSSANVVPPYHASLFNETALRRLMERLSGFELVAIDQGGPAAFDLIHHIDTGNMWDITIPNAQDPTPRSLQIQQYDAETAERLNVLSDTNKKLGDYFARNDGRLMLIAYCRKIK